MDTTKLNEALIANIELIADIDLDKMNVHKDENGLVIEGSFGNLMNIMKAFSDIDEITEESILNYYSMMVDFENKYISFIRKEEK